MEKNFEIIVICNKYKDTLNDFIDNLNTKSSNWLELIDKGSRNVFRFKGNLIRFLKENYLNKNVIDKLLRLAPKTGDF